jgi:hypothetical protein
MSTEQLSGVLGAFGLCERSRDVAVGVQDTPHVHMFVVIDVEDDVGELAERPGARLGDVELIGIAERSREWMPAEMAQRGFESIDETRREGCAARVTNR